MSGKVCALRKTKMFCQNVFGLEQADRNVCTYESLSLHFWQKSKFGIFLTAPCVRHAEKKVLLRQPQR